MTKSLIEKEILKGYNRFDAFEIDFLNNVLKTCLAKAEKRIDKLRIFSDRNDLIDKDEVKQILKDVYG